MKMILIFSIGMNIFLIALMIIKETMTSSSTLWFTKIRNKEKKLPSEFKELVIEHEKAHAKRWWILWDSQKEERLAQKIAIHEMMKRGYTFQKLLELETSLRLYWKYGLLEDEYIEYMQG